MVDESRSDAPPRRVTLSPGETVADAARKAIAFGAESLLRNQNAAESGEAEPLHQLRVASRRLRATIELFASVIYAAQLKIFRRDIPWIAHQAGACRECDVTSALIAARAGKIGTGLDTAIAPMIATLEEQRKAEQRGTRRAKPGGAHCGRRSWAAEGGEQNRQTRGPDGTMNRRDRCDRRPRRPGRRPPHIAHREAEPDQRRRAQNGECKLGHRPGRTRLLLLRRHHNAARSSTGWRGRRAKLPRANDRSGLGERILNEHRWMRAIFARKPGKLNEWRQDLRINLRCDVSNG